MTEESRGYRILKLSIPLLLIGGFLIVSPAFAGIALGESLTESMVPYFYGLSGLGFAVVIPSVIGLFYGYRKDKKFLEQKYGKSPDARPIKSTGLALYFRQRKSIVQNG